jgi:1,4-dihydroxy-2-naphthoate polyprenyltransferase
MRPHTLNAAVMPVLIGTALAYSEGTFKPGLFAAMMASSVIIQAAVNMYNEYFDYKRGLDSVESVGIGGVIVRDELHEQTVLRTAVVFFSLAIILGVYICVRTNWWIAVVGAASMGAGYFYSAGKHPIAYTAFGEVTSGIFMGPVIVLISYFIQREAVTFPVVMISVPISILVSAILMANNIRDSEGDARKGRKTLAILLGRDSSIKFLYGMFMASYVWTAALVLYRVATPWLLIVFIAMPDAIRSVRIFRATSTPAEMMPAMKAASRLHARFGILFAAGILLGSFLPIR